MPELSFKKVKPEAAARIEPFFREVLSANEERIHSIHITGTALTDDYNEKTSDVNSIIVLKEMDLKFLEMLAPLGKKYGKSRVSAPLIMTPGYITSSLDVFPVEFLNFKLIHSTVYGDDLFAEIEISRKDLRHQCERELKTKLIWLRQGYLSSQGDRKILSDGFISAIAGYIPLFRGISVLLQKEPPLRQSETVAAMEEAAGINTDAFIKVLNAKRSRTRLSIEELTTIFEDYYAATEKLGQAIDELDI